MTAALPPFPCPPSEVSDDAPGRLPLRAFPVPMPEGAHESFIPVFPPLESVARPKLTEQPSATTPLPAPVLKMQADFTDDDLTEALLPLVASAGAGGGFRDDPSFEAVLRATFRRALAEHSSGPFQDPGLTHRTLWRFQALFTSRSYDEVLAEKIRRFKVEEVYLLDRDRLSLVSYASNDPVRHANARKVGSFARQLALRVRDESGALQLGFELGEGRRTFVRSGSFCHLVAVIKGEINDLLKSDLDFALRRIETRYRTPFVQGHPLLRELQPLLEECLLIHSPAAPTGP